MYFFFLLLCFVLPPNIFFYNNAIIHSKYFNFIRLSIILDFGDFKYTAY